MYGSGSDMWKEYCVVYGVERAREICQRYLDMQASTLIEEELVFCHELSEAMKSSGMDKFRRTTNEIYPFL